ncbi:hypothetical protein [Okeania sp. KiyG1]|uniref:hypothetical protein n=1 Tax=Okeania sp. KiyG1 TaxID=2720165 RepID=UPI0019216161|nr:hypothetical protein [Okeania sp. KiyG1]GGA30582.1 hypothetical protein CYANOKiyG1_47120 [Okeania sp. KiyG1]
MSNFNSSNSAIKDKNKPPENIQENTKIELYEDQTKTVPEWFKPDKNNFSAVLWAEGRTPKYNYYEDHKKTVPEWFKPDKNNFSAVLWAEGRTPKYNYMKTIKKRS